MLRFVILPHLPFVRLFIFTNYISPRVSYLPRYPPLLIYYRGGERKIEKIDDNRWSGGYTQYINLYVNLLSYRSPYHPITINM